VHYSAKPGGIEVLLPSIIGELKDKTVKVFVIRPQNEKDVNVYKGIDVEIRYGSQSTIVAMAKLFSLAVRDNKAIFHLFNTGPFFLLALKLAGAKKIIYSIHGTIYWKTSFQKFVRKTFWNLVNSKKIVFTSNSDYSAKVFKEKIFNLAEVKRIYNPINLSRFNSSSRNPGSKDELNIIYAGRLTDGKNLFLWIETAEYLIQSGIKAVFNIYGTGELYTEIEKRIQESKYHKRIRLNGHASKIEEVYKKADLLLFLSEYESYGNVVVEAILSGVPVIAFNIPSMEEIFEEDSIFLIDKSKNTGEQVLSKVKQIEELKSATYKVSVDFQKRFSTKQHIEKLSSIYADFE